MKSLPALVFALLTPCFADGGTVRYVDLNNPNPASPYLSWATAAPDIQAAVDAADAGDQILVTNGVYETGGRVVYGALTNRVAVTKPVSVSSVNGPAVTVIKGLWIPNQSPMNPIGHRSVRCIYLTNDAVLTGFTLTNGGVWVISPNPPDQTAAGAWCENTSVISNCVIQGNAGYMSAGGVYQGLCYDSVIISNSASVYGGGAVGTFLQNCTLVGNRQTHPNLGGGGGAYLCALTNCLLKYNSSAAVEAGAGGGGAHSSTLDDCVLAGNSAAYDGGAAYGGTLRNCLLTNNSARTWGGATYSSTLTNCLLAGNSSVGVGGGVRFGLLSNCCLSNNLSQSSGGGASEAVLLNCRLLGNSGFNGGGVSLSTAINCLLVSNVAVNVGGAAYAAALTNCTILGNSAFSEGGVRSSTLANSILYFNSALSNPDYDPGSTINYCCVAPLPAGVGNISNPPEFASLAPIDLHLQSNSACINSGANGSVAASTDLDGLPRVAGGTVDLGAFEFPDPTSTLSYAWLQTYGLPTDGSADNTDADGDGLSNKQEWICDTVPTNSDSALRLLSPFVSPGGLVVQWQSVNTRSYFVERAAAFSAAGPSFSVVADNLPGSVDTTSFTNDFAPGPYFYRVGVRQ